MGPRPLVQVWKSSDTGRWYYDCERCHRTESRNEWAPVLQLADRHARERHTAIGFTAGKR